MTYLDALKLKDFRNHQDFSLKCGDRPILIIGPNGSGKTNILEAISLLMPGKGMRAAKADDVVNCASRGCCIFASTPYNQIGIECILGKKIVYINGKKSKHYDLTRIVDIVWLTPQMNRIFIGPSADRRRFFDRAVFGFYKSHARNIIVCEHAMRERLKLLTTNYLDDKWLANIEMQMAKYGLEIVEARRRTIEILQDNMDRYTGSFPKAIFKCTM